MCIFMSFGCIGRQRLILLSYVLLSCFAISTQISSAAVPDTAQRIYEDFAREIAADISELNATRLNQAIDVRAILDATLIGLELPPDFVKSFQEGVRESLASSGNTLVRHLNPGDVCTFVRLLQKETPRALLRINYANGAVSLLELYLRLDGEEEVRVIDWYEYQSGQSLTRTARTMLIINAPDVRPVFELWYGPNPLGEKEKTQLFDYFVQKAHGQYDEALEAFDLLPQSYRSRKSLLLSKALTARQVDDDDYHEVLATIANSYGDDPRLALLLFDYYYRRDAYDEAVTVLEGLIDYLGGEAALFNLVASMQISVQDYARAITACRKAIETEPLYAESYDTLFKLYRARNQFLECIEVLEMQENKLGIPVDYELLEDDDDNEYLLESDEFKRWRKKRKS